MDTTCIPLQMFRFQQVFAMGGETCYIGQQVLNTSISSSFAVIYTDVIGFAVVLATSCCLLVDLQKSPRPSNETSSTGLSTTHPVIERMVVGDGQSDGVKIAHLLLATHPGYVLLVCGTLHLTTPRLWGQMRMGWNCLWNYAVDFSLCKTSRWWTLPASNFRCFVSNRYLHCVEDTYTINPLILQLFSLLCCSDLHRCYWGTAFVVTGSKQSMLLCTFTTLVTVPHWCWTL